MTYQNFNQNHSGNYLYTSQSQPTGIVGAPDEQFARTYPVALGTCVTFRNEYDPTVFYTKTMGNSPLDAPIFEKYRMVKEEVEAQPKEEESAYLLKEEIKPLLAQFESLKKEVATLRKRMREDEDE